MANGTGTKDLTPRLTRLDRERLRGHTGLLVLFTGLSGAGKSTLANLVEVGLHRQGVSTQLLDGDVLRQGLCADLGFGPDERRENLRRLGQVGRILVEAGVVALAAFIAPLRSDRALVREVAGPESFVEVFVDCPLHVCERRDPKGLYARARAGRLAQFTGVSAPYEPPTHADVVARSDGQAPADAASAVLRHLRNRLGQRRALLL